MPGTCMKPNQQSIIIVGGGIVGSYLAYECALAGWEVDEPRRLPKPELPFVDDATNDIKSCSILR